MIAVKIIIKLFLTMLLISAALVLFGVGLDFNREYERTKKNLKLFLFYFILACSCLLLFEGIKKIWGF